jgi:hypothetical protein
MHPKRKNVAGRYKGYSPDLWTFNMYWSPPKSQRSKYGMVNDRSSIQTIRFIVVILNMDYSLSLWLGEASFPIGAIME